MYRPNLDFNGENCVVGRKTGANVKNMVKTPEKGYSSSPVIIPSMSNAHQSKQTPASINVTYHNSDPISPKSL